MRTALILAAGFATLGLPGTASAQQDTMVVIDDDPPIRTTFGIKGGLTFATLSQSNLSPNFGNQTGFAAGLHLALPLGTSILMFQPEAMISQQGATSPAPGGTLTEDGSYELTYLMVPANLRVNLSTGGAQPYLLGGPYVGFRLNCQFEDVDVDCDDFKDTDWGLGFGAGLKFGRSGGFFIEGRYQLGLQDIDDLSEGFNSRNRVFMALAGISF